MFEKSKRFIITLNNNLIHLAHWILGFPTVVHSNGKFEMKGPSWWIQMILAFFVIYERMDILVKVYLPVIRKNYQIGEMIHLSVKMTELLCLITCWITRSKYRSEEIIQFHTDLEHFDTILMKKQKSMFENSSKMYRGYIFLSSFYVICEKINRRNDFQIWLRELRYVSMNMGLLYFFAQIYECILRMKVLNGRLNDTKPINGDFGNSDEYIKLAKAFEKIKKVVDNTLKEISFVVSF